MSQFVLSIKDIPAEGREFSFSDPAIWAGPWEEFGLGYAMREPLEATLQVLPQKDGLLLRGELHGVVAAPCDRCAEEARLEVSQRFDEFEPLPAEDAQADRKDEHGRHGGGRNRHHGKPQEPVEEAEEPSPLVREGKSGLELDVGDLLWEQFLLALPVKPLCAEMCKGLCPKCGQNRNQKDCGCPEDEGDPRMAPLRNVRLS